MQGDNKKTPLKTVKCINCNTEFPAGSKYCTECGNPLPEISSGLENVKSLCPKCYAEFDSEIEFCKQCGTRTKKIADNSQKTTCPRCFTEIESDLMYCPVCSSRIEASADKRCPKCRKEVPPGRPYCPACGTHLNAKKSFNTKIREKLRIQRESHEKTIPDESFLTSQRKVELIKEKPGYLVCDDCGDYYELQPGESADDFVCDCPCGGKLKHKLEL